MFNLEKEALIASGITDERRIADYLGKLDSLCRQFLSSMPYLHDHTAMARILFDALWREKPARYKPHHHYRLNDVIDASLSSVIHTVGNCLGLTLLYNCLLKRIGIKAQALYLDMAFDTGPHVLTLLHEKGRQIDVENIFPNGFDYKGHLGNPSRTTWGDRELVADIYLSKGNEFFEKKKYAEALKSYETAIDLNPLYEKAHLNRAILLDKIEMEEKRDRSPNHGEAVDEV
ncbi:MAG: tetratricopeptide repeat protein [Thermodesulfobacteriota bacterium]|nr:tetratricopeptide repeat protein [Thermodesulfobacteriota bacterium]